MNDCQRPEIKIPDFELQQYLEGHYEYCCFVHGKANAMFAVNYIMTYTQMDFTYRKEPYFDNVYRLEFSLYSKGEEEAAQNILNIINAAIPKPENFIRSIKVNG